MSESLTLSEPKTLTDAIAALQDACGNMLPYLDQVEEIRVKGKKGFVLVIYDPASDNYQEIEIGDVKDPLKYIEAAKGKISALKQHPDWVSSAENATLPAGERARIHYSTYRRPDGSLLADEEVPAGGLRIRFGEVDNQVEMLCALFGLPPAYDEAFLLASLDKSRLVQPEQSLMIARINPQEVYSKTSFFMPT